MNGIQEVCGSIPHISTKKYLKTCVFRYFFAFFQPAFLRGVQVAYKFQMASRAAFRGLTSMCAQVSTVKAIVFMSHQALDHSGRGFGRCKLCSKSVPGTVRIQSANTKLLQSGVVTALSEAVSRHSAPVALANHPLAALSEP